MTDLITTVNRTLTAKEFQGLADHERAAQAAEPIVWRHGRSLAYIFSVLLDFRPRRHEIKNDSSETDVLIFRELAAYLMMAKVTISLCRQKLHPNF